MPDGIRRIEVRRVQDGRIDISQDAVALEEPLQIRVGRTSLCVTMRTPGHDDELAAGFLLSEGVVSKASEIEHIEHCRESGGREDGNLVVVSLARSAQVDLNRLARPFTSTSSCGICGKASIEEVRRRVAPIATRPPLRTEVLCSLPRVMRSQQRVFDATGALHAAALFDAAGKLICLREDIGRHNAVDKVIGWSALEGHVIPPDAILLVSGRASFEIVQKAMVAPIPTVAAISAASSLAIDLAREGNMNLLGFLRDGGYVDYTSRS